MVGLHVVGHMVRRAVDSTTHQAPDHFHMHQLKSAARLYEDTPDAHVDPYEVLPMAITVLIFIVIWTAVSFDPDSYKP